MDALLRREAFGHEKRYVQAWVDAAQECRGFGYGLFRNEDGRLVGSTSVQIRLAQAGAFDLGYWVHVDFVGLGLGRTAAAGTAETMFALAAVSRMQIQCDERNQPSAAIARSLGCTLDRIDTESNGKRVMAWRLDRPDTA